MAKKEDTPVTLEDLQYFWMQNGAPCFMADRDDICEVVESLGFQIYYLIADLEINKEVKGKDSQQKETVWIETTHKARVLKVVNNIIGRSISETDDSFGSDVLAPVEETATYHMPKIPKTIVNKLDEFFRLVHAQHGTESIVILTFDPTVGGSEGWGVLVPEQVNTSVHCKYDADSIAEIKPDHVMIVGSVHSHPEMSAYASGTDHADQADFDGVHITYGWQKSKNGGATEYHAEMQMNGTAYILNIDDVFEDAIPLKDPDPEVVAWSDKVKKALPPYQAGAWSTPVAQSSTVGHSQGSTPTTGIKYYGGRSVPPRIQSIPFDVDNDLCQLIVEVDTSVPSMICPSCNLYLFKSDVDGNGFCPACDIPLVAKDSSLGEIEFLTDEYLRMRNKDIGVAYYLWCKDQDKQDFLIQIKPDELDNRPSPNGSRVDADKFQDYTDEQEWQAGLSLLKDNSIFFYTEDVTLCCGCQADRAWTECKCGPTVYYEDIDIFEKAAHNIEIYQADSICQSCALYNLPECSAYRNMIIDFVSSQELPSKTIDGCDQWIDFTKVASDIDSGIYDSY